MSLLDTGAKYEPVVVYPEVMAIDEDGNKFTKPATTPTVVGYKPDPDDPDGDPIPIIVGPIQAIARFQVQNQSGTSARRAEQDNEGFESEKVYRMRFPRSFTKTHGILGAQSKVVWRDQTWAVFGDATVYNGSEATARVDYTVKRF